MEDISTAITEAIEAGRNRKFVRDNGPGLAGLSRLADRHSAACKAALDRIFADAVYAPQAR